LCTVNLHFDGHEVKIQEVCYILDLAESIYCLFLHIQCPTHGLHSLFDAGLHIEFPTFTTKAVLGQNDIYLNAVPSQSNATSLSISSIDIPSNTIFRHVTQPDRGLIIEPTGEDNILRQLRKFYQEVKHKRQLNLDVPAGFCRDTTHQQNYRYATPPRKTKQDHQSSLETNTDQPLELEVDPTALTPVHSNKVSTPSSPMPSSDPPMHVPIVH